MGWVWWLLVRMVVAVVVVVALLLIAAHMVTAANVLARAGAGDFNKFTCAVAIYEGCNHTRLPETAEGRALLRHAAMAAANNGHSEIAL